ncbi:MAG TPA: ATP synthase F1 subunit delta [Myxococcota bacterium]|nr:ATP synthase F1 subunit delta [Myxococcota bacterium]
MADANAARRYARALVELAVESEAEEIVLGELQRLVANLAGDGRELRHVLCSPVFSAEERAAVLGVILPRLGVGRVTASFLRLLSDRGRFGVIDEVLRLYTAAMDERAGRVRVHVSTTEPLSPQMEHAIRVTFERATGKQVVLDASIDASLIGGMVARLGDRVFDASLRTRLDDLRRKLLTSTAAAEA